MKEHHPPSEVLVVPSPGEAAHQSDDWTLRRLLDWTAGHLAKKGVESPRLDTEVLLAHALDCRRIELYTRHDEIASDEARQRFRELVRQRLEGCPVAYLVGRKEFFSLEFEVGPAVLIPRPDSEFVVMECLRLAKNKPQPSILDIGTGSGNLSIAIAKQNTGAMVTTIDVSPEALEVARRNAAKHGVAERIRFLAGDLFAPLAEEQFDFIISNPPYIAREEMANLPAGVRDYEPRLALDGGPGGFEVLDRILESVEKFLTPDGYLILEIGSPQEAPARQRIATRPNFELAETVRDYSRHPRVLCAQWKGK